ncbi:MAG: hypothetical protein HOJ35_11770 [Bdellovibrionales bacterium]|jgi:hypothetical protein|nr:hypothetical protein [Bdellovibrionales bacterium]
MNRLILLLTFLLLSVSVMAEPPTDPPADSECSVNTDCNGGKECDSSAGTCFTPVEQAEGETCSSGQVWNRRSGECVTESVSSATSDCNTQASGVRSTPDSTGGPESSGTGSSTESQ